MEVVCRGILGEVYHKMNIQKGYNVEICDGSIAHGNKGKVLWVQDDGLIIVELEEGCAWPVTETELKVLEVYHV